MSEANPLVMVDCCRACGPRDGAVCDLPPGHDGDHIGHGVTVQGDPVWHRWAAE